MKADPKAQERLLDLQEYDLRLSRLERLERELPERAELARLTAARVELRADVASTSGVLEDLRAELSRTEADVAVVEGRIARDNEQLMTSSSSRDATSLDHEITSLRRRQGELEEIQLAVMEQVEEHETALGGLESQLSERDREVDDAESAVEAALQRIRDERAQVADARAGLVAELPADLVALYEKQRARYGAGASLLRRGVSEASGVALNADELAKVAAAAPDDVLICSSSEAVLVRTAESGL